MSMMQHSFPFASGLSKGRALLKKARRKSPQAAFEQGELILTLADRMPDVMVRR
jgi:hypothetical protein